MILLVTTTRDIHADILVDRLNNLHTDFLRLNIDDFPQKIKVDFYVDNGGWQAKFYLPLNRIIDCQDITAGWCRALPSTVASQSIESETDRKIVSQESDTTIQGILALLANRYWMNHPQKTHKAYAKILQLNIAQEIGFSIPPTRITNSPELFHEFFTNRSAQKVTKMIGLPWALSEKGYLIYTNIINETSVSDLSDISFCPTLIQEFVPKESELRVTVVGTEIFAMEIHSQLKGNTAIDWRKASADDLKQISSVTVLSENEKEQCLTFLKKYELEYGAFDFIRTPDGRLVFLEMNPHGAWGFAEYNTDMPISYKIAEQLARASQTRHSEPPS